MNKDQTLEDQIVVSYVPFFSASSLNHLEDLRNPNYEVDVLACTWNESDDGLVLCMHVNKAIELCDHMHEWAENEPQKWFSVHLKVSDGVYSLAIIPNLRKTLERFRMLYQLRTGYPFPLSRPISFYFKPIKFSGTRQLSINRSKVNVVFEDVSSLKRTTVMRNLDLLRDSSYSDLL